MLHAQEISVTASVGDRIVYENEPFRYTVTVEGSANFDKVSLGESQEIELQPGRTATSENFSIINGRVTRSKSITYTLIPKKSGKMTIPPASVKIDGTLHASNPVELTVLKGQQSPQVGSGPPQSGNKDVMQVPDDQIFIKPIVSKTSLFVGEGATVTYKLYYRVNITRYEQTQDIKPEGFWKEEFDIDEHVSSQNEYLNGALYRVATIKKFRVFPTRAGELEISPYRAVCEVLMTDVMRNRWGLSMNFNQFFNSMGKTMKAEVYAPAIKFEVKPLPSPQPDGFNGAVGKFDFEANLDKDTVQVGTPVSFKFKVAGEGNIATLPEISLELPSIFEQYDPKVQRDIKKQGNLVTGEKVTEIIAIPRTSGDFELGRVKFVYFDPEKRKYITLSSPEMAIYVKQGSYSPTSAFADKREIARFGTDIRFIKTDTETLHPKRAPIYRSAWFYGSMMIPALAFVFFFIQKQRDEKMQGDVAYARRYKANPEARKRLKAAKTFLKENSQQAFFAELEAALIKFIGNKFNIAEQAMTKDEIKSVLQSKSVSSEMIEQLMHILTTSEMYRYAPSVTSKENLDAFYEEAEKIISELSKSA
ncbi:BatD family protein [Chloroherpeton thalassium]|nr:BatD family protein [Chloroherpeton thalassium]